MNGFWEESCTCILLIVSLEGTEEVRLVRKQLLSQDFKSQVFCPLDAKQK